MALVVKNLPANSGDRRDTGLIPGSGRSPGGGYGKPLQYSCLENLMDRRIWQTMVHRIAKSPLKLFSMHVHMCPHIHVCEGFLLKGEFEVCIIVKPSCSLRGSEVLSMKRQKEGGIWTFHAENFYFLDTSLSTFTQHTNTHLCTDLQACVHSGDYIMHTHHGGRCTHTRAHTHSPWLGISILPSSLRAHLPLAPCPLGRWETQRPGETEALPKMLDQASGPVVGRGDHVSGSHLSCGGQRGSAGARQS